MMAVENKKVKPDDVEKSVIILFFDSDYWEGFNREHNEPIVISIAIHNYIVKRILVNWETSGDILYNAIAIGMNIFNEDLKPYLGHLINFSSK